MKVGIYAAVRTLEGGLTLKIIEYEKVSPFPLFHEYAKAYATAGFWQEDAGDQIFYPPHSIAYVFIRDIKE